MDGLAPGAGLVVAEDCGLRRLVGTQPTLTTSASNKPNTTGTRINFAESCPMLYPSVKHQKYHFPTASSLSRVRKKIVPAESAGVAMQVSPSRFVAVTEKFVPVGTTYTFPTSLVKYKRLPSDTGEAVKPSLPLPSR